MKETEKVIFIKHHVFCFAASNIFVPYCKIKLFISFVLKCDDVITFA